MIVLYKLLKLSTHFYFIQEEKVRLSLINVRYNDVGLNSFPSIYIILSAADGTYKTENCGCLARRRCGHECECDRTNNTR